MWINSHSASKQFDIGSDDNRTEECDRENLRKLRGRLLCAPIVLQQQRQPHADEQGAPQVPVSQQLLLVSVRQNHVTEFRSNCLQVASLQ